MSCYRCSETATETTNTKSVSVASSTATADKAKTGDGYAKITLLYEEEPVLIAGENNNQEIGYTGTYKKVKIKDSGYYRLEAWGAQGGYAKSTTYRGGYGGYSTGLTYLEEGTILYVNVGGVGANGTQYGTQYLGGYNGGGYGTSTDEYYAAGGGGATHIAKVSGLLSTLSSQKENLLIVAGGGAGAHYYGTSDDGNASYGGSGGGYIGETGEQLWSSHVCKSWSCTLPGVSDQDKSGENGHFIHNSNRIVTLNESSFGQAGDVIGDFMSSGPGGGWYGGAGAGEIYSNGGSGYIGSALLTNKVMYCYNCTESSKESTKTISTTNISADAISNYVKKGNGAAKIWQGSDELKITYDSRYGELPVPIRDGYIFIGWYTNSVEGEKITGSNVYNIMGNQTLYAHWEKNFI